MGRGLNESAIVARFIFSREIRRLAIFDFCNTIALIADMPADMDF
jgi:hypothetical protein